MGYNENIGDCIIKKICKSAMVLFHITGENVKRVRITSFHFHTFSLSTR